MSARKSGLPAFKAKIALAAREKPVAELGSEFKVPQTVIHNWVCLLKELVPAIFPGGIKTEEACKEKEIRAVYAKSCFRNQMAEFSCRHCLNDRSRVEWSFLFWRCLLPVQELFGELWTLDRARRILST